jgi:hypothetical protein
VRSILLRALAVVCALHVSGVHWLALQTVAWTGMLVARSQKAGVEEAVRTTFDGQHPCRLCEAVKEGHKQEREEMPFVVVQALAKANFLQPQVVRVPEPSVAIISYGWLECRGSARGETPPTPPPRLA